MEQSTSGSGVSGSTLPPAVPAIPDLFFPQNADKVQTVLEHNVTFNAGRANSDEYIEIPAGTTIYRLIDACKFARWTGIEWIFSVSRNDDEFFVRATPQPGIWEEVESEEPSAAISGS